MAGASDSVKQNRSIQLWARMGFAVGGVLYVIIGVLALLVALENRGRPAGPEGAIQRIGARPFGHVLLAIAAAGFLGYALWCFIQAIFDTDHDGNNLKGVALRVGEFCSGLAYIGLGILTLHRIDGEHSNSNAAQHWTAKLLAYSWGPWIVGLIGIIIGGVGLALLVYAVQERFRKYLRLGQVNSSGHHWIIQLGKWGYSAQGVVFCVIGAFLVSAATHSDPRKVQGLDGALQSMVQQRYGPWVLGIVAAGLVAYGLFMLVEARYRQLT